MPKIDYIKSKRRVDLTVGDSVRVARELNELSQNQLAEMTGIEQATISSIENNRITLGVERAKTLARALHCHPSVLLFPTWNISKESIVDKITKKRVFR